MNPPQHQAEMSPVQNELMLCLSQLVMESMGLHPTDVDDRRSFRRFVESVGF